MTALCIIGGVLLFFVWLFTRKLHIGAGFADNPFLYVRILFLKLKLPPEKAAHTEENPKEQTTEKGRKKKAKKRKGKSRSSEKGSRRVYNNIHRCPERACSQAEKISFS